MASRQVRASLKVNHVSHARELCSQPIVIYYAWLHTKLVVYKCTAKPVSVIEVECGYRLLDTLALNLLYSAIRSLARLGIPTAVVACCEAPEVNLVHVRCIGDMFFKALMLLIS